MAQYLVWIDGVRNRQRVAQHQGEQGLYRQRQHGHQLHSQVECFAQCSGRHLACRRSPINICQNDVCVQPDTEAREGEQSLLLPQSQGFLVANRVTSDLKVPSSHCEESAAETNYHEVQRKAGVPTHQGTRNVAEVMGNCLGLTRDRTLGWRS